MNRAVTKGARLLCLVALVVLGSGCVATKYEPIMQDSPIPTVSHNGGEVKPCELLPNGDAGDLQQGDRCMALVRAEAWLSLSHIRVAAGQRYQIDIPEGQFWFDKGRRSSPPQGDAGSSTMNLLEWAKRHEDQPWFALNAATVPCIQNLENKTKCMETLETEKERFNLFDAKKPSERSFELHVKEEGQLAFYANDAVLFGWRFFYGNNGGQVWLMVQRLHD